MHALRCFALVLACLAWASTAQALTRDAVRCVQGQLNAAGFEAGPIDGLVGRKTRAALKAYQDANGKISARPFSRGTALIFCRFIGLHDPALKTHWLTGAGGAEIILGGGYVQAVEVLKTEKPGALPSIGRLGPYVKANLFRLNKNITPNLAAPVRVAIANSPKEARRLQRKHSRYTPTAPASFIKSVCTTPNLGGYALPDLVILCRDGSPLPIVPPSSLRMEWVVIHELFHAVQYQLTGAQPVTSKTALVRSRSPLWLIEGSADYVGIQSAVGISLERFQTATLARFFAATEKAVALKRLQTHEANKKNIGIVYVEGSLAVSYLLRDASPKQLLTFYEEIGRVRDWKDAFETTFGAPYTQFRDAFETTFVGKTEQDLGPLPQLNWRASPPIQD